MKISYRPYTAEEAWNLTVQSHFWHWRNIKSHGRTVDYIQLHRPIMAPMFDAEILTDDIKQKYREIFMNQVYNENDLRIFDEHLSEHGPKILQQVADTLSPFIEKWNSDVKIPKEIKIYTSYGGGGSYHYSDCGDIGLIILRITSGRANTKGINIVIQHELIHILIDIPIILKYNVPHQLKERIVDIIGKEYFGHAEQTPFIDSFANSYITRDAIENDLPGAVKKMMTDYQILQNKQLLNQNG